MYQRLESLLDRMCNGHHAFCGGRFQQNVASDQVDVLSRQSHEVSGIAIAEQQGVACVVVAGASASVDRPGRDSMDSDGYPSTLIALVRRGRGNLDQLGSAVTPCSVCKMLARTSCISATGWNISRQSSLARSLIQPPARKLSHLNHLAALWFLHAWIIAGGYKHIDGQPLLKSRCCSYQMG